MNVAVTHRRLREELAAGADMAAIADKLGLQKATVREYIRKWDLPRPAPSVKLDKWERDSSDDETPREARARVARDLAEGRRCAARLLSGGPCSLLLPCATHAHGR